MDHLQTLSFLDFLVGGLSFLGVAAATVALSAIMVLGAGSMSAQEMALISGIGVITLGVGSLIGALEILAGVRVRQGRGRILQTVVAVLNLSSFPIGTAFGAYALWVCWGNEETKARFEAVARGEVLP